MSQAQESRSEFRFILNNVRAESVQAVAQELTFLLPLDLPTALALLKDAPIVLLDRLTPQQARSVGSYALRLKALGADVQVTSQPVGKLRVARWPIMPDIAKRPGNQVICPNCGARLQMAVHIPASEAVAAAAAAESAPEPSSPAAQSGAQVSAPAAPRPAPQPAAQPAAAPGSPRPASAPAGPAIKFASPPPRPAAAPHAADADEVVLEPVEESGVIEVSEEPVVLEAEVSAGEEVSRAAPPPTLGQPVGGGGTCRVVLVGKIRGEKKKNAAQIMAYYLGVSEDEAVSDLTRKSFVTVGKDLTPEQAEVCRKTFDEIGVKVNIKG